MKNKIGCLSTPLIVIIFNLAIGGWSINEILSWFGKNIPWLADIIIGLFLAEVSVPIAIIGEILKIFGVF